jgi:glycosyltransferase involved in cell wall biosynthesis
MTPIRLLHVLEATVGGTRRHLLDLCLGLPREQFDQHVVCSVLRDERFLQDIETLRGAGIEVTVLPMRRDISPLADGQCLRQLRGIMAQWRPDIVHGHSSKGGFLARLAAAGYPSASSGPAGKPPPYSPRPKIVYNPHGFAFQMRTSSLRRWLYLALERYAGGMTDRLIAPCESQRGLAVRERIVPEDRVAIIPNGIRAEDFAVSVDRQQFRQALGVPAEATLIGTVAALSPQKGLEYLVRAAAAVGRERPGVHLVVAGEGPLRGPLERLAASLGAAEDTHFLGRRDDVPQLLAALDLFVLPSLWEGLPYALLEAGAAGVPVVATDIPGNADLIQPGETGLLARPGDPLDLAVTLFRALDAPGLPHMAEALRERVRRDFTVEVMIEGHVRLYRELVRQA